MYVGIDVGGTYTDAVLLRGGRVEAAAKVQTKAELLESVLEALDTVLKGYNAAEVQRVVFSTTMITNLIAGQKYEKTAMLLIPGPGLSHISYRFNTEVIILSGAVDYRGRETVPLNEKEIEVALSFLEANGYKKVGVVGKFSPRNSVQEKRVAEIIKEKHPDWQVEPGFQAGPQLNFPRRVETTFLTCATREHYKSFVNSVCQALAARKITAEAFILKADTGTLPLENSAEAPVETIFSGPAASTLGAQALTSPGLTEVVVDIGGTTTDIALILNGTPLLSAKGAKVNERLTQIRTLAVKSLPVGGDSVLEQNGDTILFRPERLGPAYCMGGPAPTPTDALRVLGLTALGDEGKAREVMGNLGAPLGMNATETAEKVMGLVAMSITAEINKMFLEWEKEPAYRIWELLQKKKARPSLVVGIGGGAEGFIPRIASDLECQPYIPPYAPVANAVGAAVALPTLQISLRADTEHGYYHIREEGIQGKIEKRSFDEKKALELAKEKLLDKAKRYGLEVRPEEIEVTHQEVFNMIRGWDTVGRLYDLTVQTRRGVATYLETMQNAQ